MIIEEAGDLLVCPDHNSTGLANATEVILDYGLADTHVVVAGSIVFAMVLPFVLFDFRFFPIGTTAAVLLGAMLMVVTTVVSQDEVYQVIGHKDNLTTIFLLLGMMLLAQYFEREQLLVRVLRRFLKPNLQFENYIWRVSLLAFVLSALFTNDACCAILTPLLLKFWEAQERPRAELETILLAIATSANIGSVTTVFGNPQMALIAARTDQAVFSESRLDMRTCLIYLLIPAIFGYFINVGFLVLHYRLKTRRIEKSKLISEPSRSESEMAGLTENPVFNKVELGQTNGFVKNNTEILYDAMTEVHTERLAVPPPLETIPEDDILEISSASRSTGALEEEEEEGEDYVGIEMSSNLERHVNTNLADIERDSDSEKSDSDEERLSNRPSTSEDLRQVSVEYMVPSLQGPQNRGPNPHVPPNVSLTKTLEEHGLQMSQKMGIYRSFGAMSASEFLPPDVGTHQLATGVSSASLFVPSESVVFQVVLCVLMVVVIGLFLASNQTVRFDIGLVPMAAAVLAVTADSLLNKRSSLTIMKRVDWSILMMFFGIFVWMHGLNNTRLPRWLWHKIGLTGASLSIQNIAVLVTFIIIGSNIFSNVPLTLIVLEQLQPCTDQLALVLLLAWVATVAGNLTLFGSVANLIVAQKGVQTLKYRLTFWGYLQYGFLTTLVITLVGMFIIIGLLQIIH